MLGLFKCDESIRPAKTFTLQSSSEVGAGAPSAKAHRAEQTMMGTQLQISLLVLVAFITIDHVYVRN